MKKQQQPQSGQATFLHYRARRLSLAKALLSKLLIEAKKRLENSDKYKIIASCFFLVFIYQALMAYDPYPYDINNTIWAELNQT